MAQTGMPPLDLIRRTSAASSCAFSARAAVRSSSGRRHERGRAVLGRADRPGWPGGRPPSRLRQPVIYRITQGLPYHKAFHDVTTGSNTVPLNGVMITGYQAGPGWDPVTGLGQPRRPGPHPPAGPVRAREMSRTSRDHCPDVTPTDVAETPDRSQISEKLHLP